MLHARGNWKIIQETKFVVFRKSAKNTFKIQQNLLKLTKLSFTKTMENIVTIKESLNHST